MLEALPVPEQSINTSQVRGAWSAVTVQPVLGASSRRGRGEEAAVFPGEKKCHEALRAGAAPARLSQGAQVHLCAPVPPVLVSGTLCSPQLFSPDSFLVFAFHQNSKLLLPRAVGSLQ